MSSIYDNSKSFFYARNISEVFQQMKSVSGLKITGGCSSYAVQHKDFSDRNLSVRNIPELKILEKRERYLEMGSAVTLSEIENLGKNNLPVTLFEALKTIANPAVRNLATIGGNICNGNDFYYTMYAPFLALDASLEFQSELETVNIPMSKFEKIPENSILTKIRIPFEEWEVAVFKRLGPENTITDQSATFVFLANSQKNQISNLRIAFAGKFKFRDTELENKLLGAHLPLSGSTIADFVLEAEDSFNKAASKSNANPILIRQFWNLVNYSLEQLT